LLTLGRLVKRKGIDWFINHVFAQLDDTFIYIIAGDGPEKQVIGQSIKDKRLTDKVFCVGVVSEQTKTQLFLNSDLFIQPNIKVKGDMEGFGIAVLEANIHGLPVLGSRLEGLKDSIAEGKNGWLIESENKQHFINKILEVSRSGHELKLAGEKARIFCLQQFCWDKIADQYIDVFLKLDVDYSEH
jgi:glycosyltransferase involved in cell wall biosynthesis